MLCIVSCLVAVRAGAQDFMTAVPPGPADSPAALLENALPGPDPAQVAEAVWTSWLGVPDLATQALAAGASIGPLRAAAGASRTGHDVGGWQSAGAATGAVTPAGGAAVRVLARHDAGLGIDGATERSIEAGAGAWVRTGRHVRVWARAVQMWGDGQSPALVRPLAIGGRYERQGVSIWIEHEAPAKPGTDDGVHALGAGIDLVGARVWVEGRDHPLRGGVGITASLSRLVIGARVEAHPLLGDTVTLSIGWAPAVVAP